MPDRLRDQLQASLAAHYALERELGGGGMARVFVATETALHRRVVVKVLAQELAEGLSAERFAREIELAAALQDPHIVPLLSAGTTGDGVPYYTMPYVEGESLRARLLHRGPDAGPLPLGEAVGVLRDVARALEYAHAHGVVHRDVKPENVLLAGRSAVVADFGIAKAVSAARTAAPDGPHAGTLTSVGQSLGTPAYMAPEQVAGDAVDHRADLYAWGLVAYELLAGRHPFAHRASGAQLMTAQLAETPPPLEAVRPGLPPPLAALVMRCLAKDVDARPASATAVLEALEAALTPAGGPTGAVSVPASGAARRRRVARGAAAGALLVALGGWALAYARSRAAAAAAAGPPSLAELPFEHQGDSADAYITDGVTDEIRGRLTGVREVAVIAPASSNQYRRTARSPTEIARELGVRYLLTGTVRVFGAGDARRAVVRPELVEVMRDGQPQSRWQQPFDVSTTDVVRVQGEIAGQVVSAMEVALGGDAAQRAIVRAQQHAWAGDTAAARAWGDSAVRGFRAQLRDAPDDAQLHAALGLALALARRGGEAVAEAERGLALADAQPSRQQSVTNAYLRYLAARTALLAGNRARSLEWLEEAVHRRYFASPAWIRLEPSWAPLRGDPAFERRVAGR